MAEFKAISIKDFGGHLTSDDGATELLKFETQEAEFVIAYPTDKLSLLMKAVVSAQAKAHSKPKMQSGLVQPMPVDWFEIGKGPDQQDVLSFRLVSGGSLSFELPPGMLSQLSESLQVQTGNGPKGPPPGTSLS